MSDTIHDYEVQYVAWWSTQPGTTRHKSNRTTHVFTTSAKRAIELVEANVGDDLVSIINVIRRTSGKFLLDETVLVRQEPS